MKAVLIVAHGSRREESNEEIRNLTRQVADRVGASQAADFELVEAAFLELAAPLIPDGVQSLVDQGATTVLVVPYFLARGTHVAKDIPAEVAKAQQANPGVAISITSYLGESKTVPDLLLDIAVSGQDSASSGAA